MHAFARLPVLRSALAFATRLVPIWVPMVMPIVMMVATPGCIGKRRPQGEQAAATAATAPGAARIIQPEAVDGKYDALVAGERFRVRIDEEDPAMGAAIPLVTIVEFSDFQCPYCAQLGQTLEELTREHGQDVKLVFKQFPLPMHAQAEPAARAALAAHQQGKFWALHDKLFLNQQALSDDDLERYARAAGVDVARWREDFGSEALRQHVRDELAFGRALQVRSTPSFYVNGRFFKGAQPAEQVRAIIEEELVAARELLEAGAKREELYARFLHAAPELPGADAKPPEAAAPSPGVPANAKPDPDHVPGEASRGTNYGVPTGKDRPVKGPADALVTIVEFGAFDCAQCRSVQPVLQRLLEKYPTDVRLVFRHLAESNAARRSAQIALAAHQQGKFWEAHDRLLTTEGDFTAETAEQLAKDLGLDVEAFKRDLRARSGPPQQLQEDLAVLGVFRSKAPPPLFFINGRYLDGNASLEDFDRLVQEEKAKAQAFLTEKNIADKTQLYDTMIQGFRGYEGAQNPPPAKPLPAEALPAEAPPAEAPPQ
jgi:protein-disulfide isomerase